VKLKSSRKTIIATKVKMKKKSIALFYPISSGRPLIEDLVPSGHAFSLGIKSERIEQRSPDLFELARTFLYSHRIRLIPERLLASRAFFRFT